MDMMLILGSIAAFLTTFAFLPQVIKTHKSRHTRDLSLVMYFFFSVGLMFWLVYGVMISSIPMIAANTLTLAMSLYMIYLKLRYG